MTLLLSRLFLTFFLATAASISFAQACNNPETLRFAVIPQINNQTGHYEALITALQDELERNVVLVSVGSYSAVIEGLFDGSIDLAELGPGSYALARDRGTDITAFASLHRDTDAQGPAAYRSVLITRQDAGFQSLEALKGTALSLVDPASTSGSLVPRVALPRITGMSLENWFGRVSFAGSHDSAIDAVLEGRVAAAFVSDNRVKKALYRGRPAAEVLHILWQSDPLPSDPFVYQNRLCDSVKQAIHRVFFDRPEALQALFSLHDKQSFVPVSDKDYQPLMPRMSEGPSGS